MMDNTGVEERLIGIIGEFCDYMTCNGRCELFCPFSASRDPARDNCEVWTEIVEIRKRRTKEENEDD